MSVDDILAALAAIITEAGDNDLTDEQAERYEQLEGQLAVARRTAEIRSRQAAYETPVRNDLHVHVGTARQDDALDRAFDHYLRTGVANQDIQELRAQGTSPDSAGGYTVAPGFRQKLVEVQQAFGGLANEVEVITTSTGATMEYPTLDDTGNVGVVTAEGSTFGAGADLEFGTVSLGSFKYTSQGASTSPLRVSVELLQDAEFDVAGLVARKLGTRLARAEASAWASGVGTTEPFGILMGTTSQSYIISDSNGSGITYETLLALEDTLDPAYEGNARWVFSKSMWTQVRSITDGNGRPVIFDEAASGIGGRPQKTLLGYPVTIDQSFTFPTADTDTGFAVLGDLREAYVIRRVAPVNIIVNPYTRANYGQVEYVAWERVDGNVQNSAAYSIAKTATS